MLHTGLAPSASAALLRPPPNATPKFIAAAHTPLNTAHASPAENDILCCSTEPRARSLILPATAQIETPATTSTTPAITVSPDAVNIFSGCSRISGIRLPSAADNPSTIAKPSAIPIALTASPNKTCAIPQASPHSATSTTTSDPALEYTVPRFGMVRYAVSAGSISSANTVHTVQVFSQAHFLVNFMGSVKLAFMTPATTNSVSPAVASCIDSSGRA